MKTRATLTCLAVLAALAIAPAASAEPGRAPTATLERAARADLDRAIARERAASPRAFELVRAVRASAPAADRDKRGRLAILGPRFAALGPSALYPMLDALLHDEDASQPADVQVALRAGMLEAVARLRSPHGATVAAAWLASSDDADVVRAAAEVLARMQTDEHTALLERALARRDARVPVLEALASCRTRRGAELLARAIDADGDPRAARAAVDALGKLGSTWAWSTPELRARAAEGEAIRAAATATLARAESRWSARGRGDAGSAELATAARSALAMLC